MDRKFVNRPNWKRVLERRFKSTYIENDDFVGYVSVIYIDKVREPLVKEISGRSISLVDDKYIWLQHLPKNDNFSLTTMFDSQGKIVQWYFDITRRNGIDENNIPFFDDIYLDVVVLPTSEIILMDEEELHDALESKVITKDEYDLAYKKANEIINGIGKMPDTLHNFSYKYLEYMQKLECAL